MMIFNIYDDFVHVVIFESEFDIFPPF